EKNQDALIEICRHLDGMPLALELAAARLRTLGVDQLLARLTDRFALLTGGSRSALPRQQTLRATIDWSYDLLTEPERRMLQRLSVFAGDFGLEAVEAVCATEAVADPVLDLLAGLVDKSFVTRTGSSEAARYQLHETMQEYALLKLREEKAEDEARGAFVAYYAVMARRAGAGAESLQLRRWL